MIHGVEDILMLEVPAEMNRHFQYHASHGRDGATLSSIRREIELAGGRAMQVGGDVTSFTDVEPARLHRAFLASGC